MSRTRYACLGFVGALVLTHAAWAETVTLTPSQDNTLYEGAAGRSLSNGAGQHIFAGRSAEDRLKRAVLAFGVADSVPEGSTIENVTLTLNLSKTSVNEIDVTLHRLLASWGEGTSDANENEGGGAEPTPGDATWTHRFFEDTPWTTDGGDFSDAASATQAVADPGPYTWGSTPELVADVQAWLDAPDENHGWLVKGDEAQRSSKRFDSRENPNEDNRPQLTIEFTPGEGSAPVPLASGWGIAALLICLLSAGTIVVSSRARSKTT